MNTFTWLRIVNVVFVIRDIAGVTAGCRTTELEFTGVVDICGESFFNLAKNPMITQDISANCVRKLFVLIYLSMC